MAFAGCDSRNGWTGRPRCFLLSAVFLFAVQLRLQFFLGHPTPRDDAFIVFRVARNLAEGNGFVFNAGERLQAVSSPLYGLLAGGAWWLVGEAAPPALQALGILADSVAAFLLCLVVSSAMGMGRGRLHPAGLLAGVLYAGCSSAVLVAPNGLETGLYVCAIGGTFYFLARERIGLAVAGAAACGMLRPEGFLVAVVVLIARFRATQRIPTREAAWLALAALPYAVFALAYFGSLLPQTVVAKNLMARSAEVEWEFIAEKLVFGGPLAWILGSSVLIGALALRRRRSLPPLAVWGLAYVVLFSSVGSWWPWYLPPALFGFFGLAGIGLAAVVGLIARPRLARGAVAVAAAVAALVLARDTMIKAERSGKSIDTMYSQLREVAEWVNQCTAPTATVMLEPLGVFGYYADRRVEDYPGLASRHVTDALKRLQRRVGARPRLENRTVWWNGYQDPEALEVAIEAVRPEVLVLKERVYAVTASASVFRYYELRRTDPMFVLTRVDAGFLPAKASGATGGAASEDCWE